MKILREIVIDQFKIPVYYPANFEKITIKANISPALYISPKVIQPKQFDLNFLTSNNSIPFKGYVIRTQGSEEIKILDIDETVMEVNTLIKMVKNDSIDRIVTHKIDKGCCFKLSDSFLKNFPNYSVSKDKSFLNQTNNTMLTEIMSKINDRMEKNEEIMPMAIEKAKTSINLEISDGFLLANTSNTKLENDEDTKLYLDQIAFLLNEL